MKRFSHRLKPNEMLPDQAFGAAIVDYGNGREARVVWVRLPVYSFDFCPSMDDYAWGQRVLVHHGWHGFRTYWQFSKGWSQ